MLLLQHFTKTCTKCHQLKKFKYFSRKTSNKYGLNSQCKQCVSTHMKKYHIKNKDANNLKSKAYLEKNREKVRSKNNEWAHNNKEYISIKNKEWRDNNKEYIKEKNKQWREDNKETLKEKRKIYCEQNKEIMKVKAKIYSKTEIRKMAHKNKDFKRRTKTKQGDATTTQLINLKKRSKICYWCNVSLKGKIVHIDHYIPLSKGGEHTLSNLVITCDRCNLSKNAKDPLVFAQSIGKLL